MTTDTLLLKKSIVDAAIDLYLDDPGRVSAPEIAEAAGIPREVFYAHFDGSLFVVPAFYDLCVEQYRTVRGAIDGYETFSLEERLSTFIFLMFDFLAEHRTFVQATFAPYVVQGRAPTTFRNDVAATFAELLDSADVPAPNRLATDRPELHRWLTRQYLWLVLFWIDDESPQREQSIALTDKLVAFLTELLTFRGIERGVDLVTYLASVDVIDLEAIPFVGDWFREQDEG